MSAVRDILAHQPVWRLSSGDGQTDGQTELPRDTVILLRSWISKFGLCTNCADARFQVTEKGCRWEVGAKLVPFSAAVAKRGALQYPAELELMKSLSQWSLNLPIGQRLYGECLWVSLDFKSFLFVPVPVGADASDHGCSLTQVLAALTFEAVKGFPCGGAILERDCIGLPAPLREALTLPFASQSTVRPGDWAAVLFPGTAAVRATASVQAASRAGQRIGAYDLHERVGQGGMGDVYRATHTHLGTQVAIKFLKEEFARDAQFISRFFDEARLAHQLKHHNIVAVTDFVDAPPNVYFAMEYLVGRPLSDVLSKGKTPALPLALKWTKEVCLALSVAHRSGIIHRDIKPDNVFLCRTAEGYQAKVLDFGIAKAVHAKNRPHTEVGAVLGTPKYMSPEQAQGRQVDARTDIYAVGAVLYEMLTGTLAHDAVRPLQPVRQTKSGEVVSETLSEVVLRSLQLEPGLRPTSIEAVLHALDDASTIASVRFASPRLMSGLAWAAGICSIVALAWWALGASRVQATVVAPIASKAVNGAPVVLPPTAPIAAEVPALEIESNSAPAPLKPLANREKRQGLKKPIAVAATAPPDSQARTVELKQRLKQLRGRLSRLEADFGEAQVTSLERAVVRQAEEDLAGGRFERLLMTLSDAEAALLSAEKRLGR